MAEKVETYSEFKQAKEMGFDLFQGFFFSKPEVLSTKGISSNQMTKLELINEVNREELVLENIEELIKNDAAVSFKLLKFINSAYFRRRNPVNTIRDAISYLGTDELRKFINLVVISDLSVKKPNELVRMSIVRARMCEQCDTVFRTKFTSDELFILGLLSLMDAVLDCKMGDILEHITFSGKMKRALMGNDREFNLILKIIQSMEQGKWKNKIFAALSGKAVENKLADFYLESIKMADAILA